MRSSQLAKWVFTGSLLMAATAAQAQNCLGSPDFDACMARFNNANQARLLQMQRQTFANYLKIYGPWLRKQYAAYRGPPMSFERFAYFSMMSANGTNVAGGLQAQRDQFAGMQAAHATVQQGNASYNQGMAANSARTSQTAERYDQGAVRGNTAAIDPNTGQKVWLPYAQPDNQPFNSGGQTYMRNQSGYYQWNGNGWTLMKSSH